MSGLLLGFFLRFSVRFSIRRLPGRYMAGKSVTAFRTVDRCPYPQEGPNGMQSEEAHPSGCVDRILMRVVPRLGDIVGNVVNGNNPVGERQEDEHNDSQCEETQEVHNGVRVARKTNALY